MARSEILVNKRFVAYFQTLAAMQALKTETIREIIEITIDVMYNGRMQ